MKYSFIVLFSILSISSISAQINIGESNSLVDLSVSLHKQEMFNKLKKMETIFVLPNSLIDKEELRSTVENIWTLNKITFVDSDDFDLENNIAEGSVTANNLVIRLMDNLYVKDKKTGELIGPKTQTINQIILFRFMAAIFDGVKVDKKGKTKLVGTVIAEIYFTPNIRLRQDMAHSRGSGLQFGNLNLREINKKYGEKRGFYNYDLGYVKNYFQELNRRFVNSENLEIEDGVEKKDKINSLKSKTLYVPEWVLLNYNSFASTYGKTRTKEELFHKYDFKYEIISNEEINSKILKGDDFYYLMHTQFNQKRIISVIHSTTGEIIYLDEDSSYNIKDSDLKKLNKLVG